MSGGSQFWKGLHRVKHLFKWWVVYRVGYGNQTKFWLNVWLGDVPLKVRYHDLFMICSDPKLMVNKAYEEGEWVIYFRRGLVGGLCAQWQKLLERL
jgi:hypothetical protein